VKQGTQSRIVDIFVNIIIIIIIIIIIVVVVVVIIIYLFLYLFIYFLFIYVFIYLFIYLFICLFVFIVDKLMNRSETRDAITDRGEGNRNRKPMMRMTHTLLSKRSTRFALKFHPDVGDDNNDDDSTNGACGGKATYVNKSDSLEHSANGEAEPETCICKVGL
jgi:hypothetical protein